MTAWDKDRVVENLSQRRELSEAAKALLNDRAFGHCYLDLRQRWFGLLMDEKHAGAAQDELCARLRGLEELLIEIGLLLTDYREASRKQAQANRPGMRDA